MKNAYKGQFDHFVPNGRQASHNGDLPAQRLAFNACSVIATKPGQNVTVGFKVRKPLACMENVGFSLSGRA